MKRGRKAKCPYCRSSHTIGKGFRTTVTLGRRQLRLCRDCKHKFTVGRAGGFQPEAIPIAPMPAPAPEVPAPMP